MSRAILALVDDLFWKARLAETAKAAGRPISFLADPAALVERAKGTGLILVDLALRRDPFPALAALKQDEETRAIPVIGYFEHMRTDLWERGKAAGCDRILARSSFTEKLPALLSDPAAPAEEEP